jgi:hypothetical protein
MEDTQRSMMTYQNSNLSCSRQTLRSRVLNSRDSLLQRTITASLDSPQSSLGRDSHVLSKDMLLTRQKALAHYEHRIQDRLR